MPRRDLVADEAGGKLSATRAWLHVGNLAMTVVFTKVAWAATVNDGLSLFFRE